MYGGCKSQEALVNLQKQIKEKIASREYIAVIHGAPNSEEGQIVGILEEINSID